MDLTLLRTRKRYYFKVFCWPTLLTVVGVALLLGLGNWQLKRLEKKEYLNHVLSLKLKEPTQPLEKLLEESLQSMDSWEYKKVQAQGVFLHAQEIKLMGRTHEGNAGYHLVTPFQLSSGALVLVDRGWVPKDYSSQRLSRPLDTQTIGGVIRFKSSATFFTPTNDCAQRIIYMIHPGEIARECGYQTLLPFYIHQISFEKTSGYPKPKEFGSDLRNFHLQYAITWYLLALALTIIYILYIKKRLQHQATPVTMPHRVFSKKVKSPSAERIKNDNTYFDS